MTSKKKLIQVAAIAGPTAVGKSTLALRLAVDLGLDIVSCDSRQIYRYMNIGTAKPLAAEREQVPHWMIDIIEPSQQFSAHEYVEKTCGIIRDLHAQGRRVLLCGGTGLYLKCLCDGIGSGAAIDLDIRARLQERSTQPHGVEDLLGELMAIDPTEASKIPAGNVRRIIRALEAFHATGTPMSVLKSQARGPDDMDFRSYVMTMERPDLYKRINQRVDKMVSDGLYEEFESLLTRGYTATSFGMYTVGYRELFSVATGNITFAAAVEQIKQNSRRYSKRQETWFAHQTRDAIFLDAQFSYLQLRESLQDFYAVHENSQIV